MEWPPGSIDPHTMVPGTLYKCLTKLPYSAQYTVHTFEFVDIVNKRAEWDPRKLNTVYVNDPKSEVIKIKAYLDGKVYARSPYPYYPISGDNRRFYPITTQFPADLPIMRNLSGPLKTSMLANAAFTRKKHILTARALTNAEYNNNLAERLGLKKTRKQQRKSRRASQRNK